MELIQDKVKIKRTDRWFSFPKVVMWLDFSRSNLNLCQSERKTNSSFDKTTNVSGDILAWLTKIIQFDHVW